MRPLLILAVVLAAASVPAAARPYHPPRNAFGQPDLEGTWSADWTTPLERDEEDFKTVNIPEAEARSLRERCGGTKRR